MEHKKRVEDPFNQDMLHDFINILVCASVTNLEPVIDSFISRDVHNKYNKRENSSSPNNI